MQERRFALIALLLASGMVGPASAGLAPQERTCAEGQVPITWPLGSTGLQPRRLLTGHGQYLDLPTDDLGEDYSPDIHRGIDIAACVGDEVYAVESGWVEGVSFGEVEGYNHVVIADVDEEDVGWSYLHLDEVYVHEGDFVQRDQAIGTVVKYTRWGGYDHLHLQRIAPAYVEEGVEPYLGDGQVDAGHPLPLLVERADKIPPNVLPLEPIGVLPGPFRFRKNGEPDTPIGPGALLGEKIDVIARIEEVFPGDPPPACGMDLCDGESIAHQIVPVRLSFSIFRTVDSPSGISYPATVRELVFHNVIELDQSFVEQVEIDNLLDVYHPDTVSDYTTRKLIFVLTHCQDTGSGFFEFPGSGDYLLQLVLEDASANATVREERIAIP